MPRESITPRINLRGIESDGGHYVPLPTVEVGWQRDLGSIQIGLETPDTRQGGPDSSGRHHLVDHLYADKVEQIGSVLRDRLLQEGQPEDNATMGRWVLDAVTAGGEGFTGWYTHLDNRAQANGLIELIRKARNAAWGRDA